MIHYKGLIMPNNESYEILGPISEDYPKKLVITLLIVIALLYTIRYSTGSTYVLVQLLIDLILIFLLFLKPIRLVWTLSTLRAALAIPLLIVAALLTPTKSPMVYSPEFKSVIVASQELAYSIPLLLLLIGKPNKFRRIVSVSLFVGFAILPLVFIAIQIMIMTT